MIGQPPAVLRPHGPDSLYEDPVGPYRSWGTRRLRPPSVLEAALLVGTAVVPSAAGLDRPAEMIVPVPHSGHKLRGVAVS